MAAKKTKKTPLKTETLQAELAKLEAKAAKIRAQLAAQSGSVKPLIEKLMVEADWKVYHYEFDENDFVVLATHHVDLSHILAEQPGTEFKFAEGCYLELEGGQHVSLFLDLGEAVDFLLKYPIKVDTSSMRWELEKMVNLINLLGVLPGAIEAEKNNPENKSN